MKPFHMIAVLLVALLAAGCSLTNPAPVADAPTQTPYPTYTPYPTFTPLPTATATFLPSPTPVPTLTATPTVDPAVTPTSASGAGLQAVLLYDSNLRVGPGTSFDSIDVLNAGEPITILGRDLNGSWLYVSTASGQRGWVRVTQIQGPLDIPRIPLAPEIPTPSVTQTPAGTGTPSGTGTPGGTGTPSGPTPTAVPANTTVVLEIVAGDPEVCETVNWTMPNRFPVDNITAPILPFDSVNPQNVPGRDAFRMFRTFVPEFIDVKVKGNLTPGACNESDKTCQTVSFQLCATAPASAPTGGSEYRQNITLQVGTQSYNQMFVDAEAAIPTLFTVVAP